MSLETPEKIRNLQRKLYCKAKAEPAFRFYLLYDKICREDILRHSYALARANRGAPGVDGVSFTAISPLFSVNSQTSEVTRPLTAARCSSSSGTSAPCAQPRSSKYHIL